MKLVSTPLSRFLMGKSGINTLPQTTTMSACRRGSGFITMDSEERIIPLMP